MNILRLLSRFAPLVAVAALSCGGSSSVRKEGAVVLEQSANSTVLYGSFTSSTMVHCTQLTVERCTITRCTDVGAVVRVSKSAGTLSISGGSRSPSTATTETVGGGLSYTNRLAMMPVWRAGETITLSGSGDAMGVPMFSGTVRVPAGVDLLEPTIAEGIETNAPIMRTQPYQVRWSGAVAGDTVRITISQGTRGGDGNFVQCEVDAALGTHTVPTAVLEPFSTIDEAYVRVESLGVSRIRAGEYTIELIASSPVRTTAGTFSHGPVRVL